MGLRAPSAGLLTPLSCRVHSHTGGNGWIQKDLDRLERWGCVKLRKFNKVKCKVLQLGRGNPTHTDSLGGEMIENSFVEKYSGHGWWRTSPWASTEKLVVSWAASKGVWAAGEKGILTLYSLLLSESCTQFCCPQHKQDMELLEQIQRMLWSW